MDQLRRAERNKMRRRTSFFLVFLFLVIGVRFGLPSTSSHRTSSRRDNVQQAALSNIYDNITYMSSQLSPPLQTEGRYIVDSQGHTVKLASVNWYGASDIYFIAGGLEFRHRDEIAATIREMGFNSVRFPYSDQMVMENPIIPLERISANLDLMDDYNHIPRARDVFNACVKAMTDAGLAVIINNHITNAHWCDGKNLCDSSWKNDQYGPICKIHQTTQTWIDHWKTIMEPFVDNPLVIGADLRNEPRGLWGTMSWNGWAKAAEQASEALLAMQPNWLMFIEGISSANDCSGARARPIQLSIPHRVVYSAHVYAWSGWGSLVPYRKRAYPSFARDMEHNWAFLLVDNIAPVWVGEFGIQHAASEGGHHYWDNIMHYLQQSDADFGYWALNPRKPEGYDNETYGLLADDWKTVIDDWRLQDMRMLMK